MRAHVHVRFALGFSVEEGGVLPAEPGDSAFPSFRTLFGVCKSLASVDFFSSVGSVRFKAAAGIGLTASLASSDARLRRAGRRAGVSNAERSEKDEVEPTGEIDE